jgi:ATP-dependent helicase HrpB
MKRLLDGPLPDDAIVLPLYGALPPDAQDHALAAPSPGSRKVVLATSIAETSLTIEGVRVVVDSGLTRRPAFSPRTGMSRLETVRVSRAAAEQRCGRAGRLGPGVCYRLWSAEEQPGLMEHDRPEILDTDLTPLALNLARAGIVDPARLRWLDLPPSAALAQARELLEHLGALDSALRITAHGLAMTTLATHPRLAHMLLRARELEMGATACAVAALLEDRDIIRRGSGPPDVDFRIRLELLLSTDRQPRLDVNGDTLRRARAQNRVWRAAIGVERAATASDHECGSVLALAFPDRIARRRSGEGQRYLLRNGHGALLHDGGSLTGSHFLAVAELDGQRPHSRIVLAAPVSRADVDRLFADQFECHDIVEWSDIESAVTAVRREQLGAIVLRETPLRDANDAEISRALLDAVRRNGGLDLQWNDYARDLRERLAFLHSLSADWPDVSDSALAASAEDWLLPHLYALRRKSEIDSLDLAALLLGSLSWAQRAALDALAPTRFEVPSGSRIRIDYSDPQAPALAVRVQELFGLAETPCIGGGTVPLTLQLLSPAYRPVQVTRDLAGFWRTSYFDVRRELRGRYPKHEWPEDPLLASPTRRAKPRQR